MNIKEIELEKKNLVKIQEDYYEKLINIIRNKDDEIDCYKDKLKYVEEENSKLKCSSEILKDRLDKSEYIIKELRDEIAKSKNELNEKKEAGKDNISLITELKDAYINNDDDTDLTEAIKELKDRFLNEKVGYFEEFNTKRKKYTGENITINTILKSNINEKNITRNEAKTLLLISVFYNFNNELIQNSTYIRKLFNEDDVECKFIRLLSVEKGIDGTEVILPVSIFIKNNAHRINNLEKEIKDKVLKIIHTYAYKEFSKIRLEKSVTSRCCVDNDVLTLEKGYLKYINNDGKEKYILVQDWYCNKCSCIYLDPKRISRLDKRFSPYKLQKNKYGLIEKKDKKLKSIVDIEQIYSNSNINNIKKDEQYESNLNAESIIKKLGYSTSLGREARWNLLKNNVIPQVGKVKVINHINFLIRMNNSRSSMSNAVSEWKYDLNRLMKL